MAAREIPRGSRIRLGRHDGDLSAENDVTIDPEGPGPMEVSGRLVLAGTATIHGSLRCGELEAERGAVRVDGDLTVSRSVEGDRATLDVGEKLEAGEIDVDRELRVGGGISSRSVEV